MDIWEGKRGIRLGAPLFQRYRDPLQSCHQHGGSGAQPPISCLAALLLHTSNIVFKNVVPLMIFAPPYCEILVTSLLPEICTIV